MRFLAVIPIVALLTVPGAAYAGKKKPKEEAPALVADKPAVAAPAPSAPRSPVVCLQPDGSLV